MFDPTAFENMKVVLEGIIYDRDFEGLILVIDRSEEVNLATLSRAYEAEMELKGNSQNRIQIKCKISLKASLDNLAGELLKNHDQDLAGCQIETSYRFKLQNGTEAYIGSLFHTLSNIWGEKREIEITEANIYREPFVSQREIKAKVLFGRLVTEEQIPDFTELVDHAIKSIKQIQEFYQ